MIKIVCDRCGEEIGSDDNELHFTKVRNTRFGYDKLMHLCESCLKQFDEFMQVNL